MHRFDVFGRLVGVERVDGKWRAVFVGQDGKHRHARGVTIPPWIEAAGLTTFLADLFHESATPERPEVLYLGTDDV